MNLRKLGVDSMAVAVALAVGGGVGFVAGESRHALLQERITNLGYADWVENTATGQSEFVIAIPNADGNPNWDATFIVRPELKRSR